MAKYRRRLYGTVFVLLLATTSGCAVFGGAPADDVSMFNGETETVHYDLRIVNNESGATLLDDSGELGVSNETEYKDPMKKGEDYLIIISTRDGAERQYTWSEESRSHTLSIEFRDDEIIFSTSTV